MKTQEWMMAWVNLAHAGRFLTDALDAHLRETIGIGLAEQDLLKQVAVNEGRLKLSELARRLFFSKAGMTKMLDRLEREGLVKRVRSADDRRAYTVQLSAAGQARLEQSRPLLKAWVAENLRDRLSEEQIHQLRDALRGLLESHGRYQAQLRHLRGEASDPEGPVEPGRQRP